MSHFQQAILWSRQKMKISETLLHIDEVIFFVKHKRFIAIR